MKKVLYVFLNDKLEGTLRLDEQGGLVFQYEENVEKPLSLSLPIRKEVFSHKECYGYFNGLLPESDEARVHIAHKYNIKNPNNDFEILQAIGYDCPGAVSFSEYPNNNGLSEYYDMRGEAFSEKSLEKFIKELPEKPLGTGAKNLRLSLAGAQVKTAVLLKDNEIMLPDITTPTTHIIKPAIKNLKETVENEYICLKTAEKLGIKVPKVEIRQVGKTKFLLVERYDREQKNGKIKRLHQEDFCQALNISSAYKYEIYGGVSFKNCFEVLKRTSKPAVNIKDFLERMIFNYLIINNDAHGKNFSVIYNNDKIEFTPAYDILCTKIYGKKLDYQMAMSIGGYFDSEGIQPIHFQKLAKDIGVSYTQLKNRIKYYCDILPNVLQDVVNSFENTKGKHMLLVVKKQCYRNLKRFK